MCVSIVEDVLNAVIVKNVTNVVNQYLTFVKHVVVVQNVVSVKRGLKKW